MNLICQVPGAPLNPYIFFVTDKEFTIMKSACDLHMLLKAFIEPCGSLRDFDSVVLRRTWFCCWWFYIPQITLTHGQFRNHYTRETPQK